MSRATGFAIEVRERYLDVVGDRWPEAPCPQPDELLSSWLHRLAILRETACRSRSTWTQFCALCLAEDHAPYFRRSWRLASRISCFRHCCGLRDRCPACHGGIAPFAQTDLIPHYVCARCGFDLRGAARISVEAAARRLERSIDDICKAEIAKGSSAIHQWVARLLHVPVVVGVGSGRPLANLPVSARIRCFERLAQRADDGLIAGAGETVGQRRRMAPTPAARDGLIARFVDVFDGRQESPRFARAQPAGADLVALMAAYARAVGRGIPVKARVADAGPRNSLAA